MFYTTNKMKLIIKSKQDYGTHIDEFEETFECTREKVAGGLILNFDSGNIIISDKKITYKRGENEMNIEEGIVTECDFNTEYGMMVLDVEGKGVEITGNMIGLIARANYLIKIVGVEPYKSEIEIVLE